MSAKKQRPEFVIIGRISKSHGVRGAVKVEPITDDPNRFTLLGKVHIGPEDAPGDAVDIERVQFQNKFIILSLSNITSREAADRLRGQYLHIPVDQSLDLPDGSVYIYDLIGLKVYTNRNTFVGTVKDYQEFPANDLFVVEKDDREYLIPDVPEIVQDIDLDNGHVIINPIEGLLD